MILTRWLTVWLLLVYISVISTAIKLLKFPDEEHSIKNKTKTQTQFRRLGRSFCFNPLKHFPGTRYVLQTLDVRLQITSLCFRRRKHSVLLFLQLYKRLRSEKSSYRPPLSADSRCTEYTYFEPTRNGNGSLLLFYRSTVS